MQKIAIILCLFFCVQPCRSVTNNNDVNKDITVAYENSNEFFSFKIIQKENDTLYYFLIDKEYNYDNPVFDTVQIVFEQDSRFIHTQKYEYGNLQCSGTYTLKNKQLDGKGQKELIIEISIEQRIAAGMNGVAIDSKYGQIWNLDTKTKMFDAKTYCLINGGEAFFTDYLDEDYLIETGDTLYMQLRCGYKCKYGYNVSYLEDKKERYILFVELVENYRSYDEDICPEDEIGDYPLCDTPKLEEGIYTIKNGIYEKKKASR